MEKPVIYMNGRFLNQKISGTQRYALELLRSWDKMNLPFTVKLVCPTESKQIKFNNIDIVIARPLDGHLWEHITFPVYVKLNHGVPLTISGSSPIISKGFVAIFDTTSTHYPQAFDWKFRLYYGAVNRIATRKCLGIITDSDTAKEDIESLYKIKDDKTCVAFCGVRSLDYQKKNNNYTAKKFGMNRPFFLSVGNKAPHKNQSYIYKMAKKNPEYDFVIVGGSFKSFGKESNFESSNIIFTGYISDDELEDLYRTAEGFIFPSLNEGFGIPPLEAINQGCKMIFVSNIPVFREIYNIGMNYFDPLGDGFELGDLSSYHRISENERQYYLNKYSWDNVANRIAAFISEKLCI